MTDKWTEKSVHTSVEVPLNLSRGPWQSSAHLSVKAAFTEITDKDDPRQLDSGGVFEENQSGRFAPLTYQLAFDRSRTKAKRDLAPAWGQHLQLTYRHTPFAGDYDGTLLSGRLELRFPGLVAHHSLQLAGGYEWQDPTAADANPYRFESEQTFVRGYDYHYHRHFYQGSANYALPLLYPDLHLGTADVPAAHQSQLLLRLWVRQGRLSTHHLSNGRCRIDCQFQPLFFIHRTGYGREVHVPF